MSPLEEATVDELLAELERRSATFLLALEGEHGRLRMGGHLTLLLGMAHRIRLQLEADVLGEMADDDPPDDEE